MINNARKDAEALREILVDDCIDFPRVVHTMLHKAADLIESLAAELEQVKREREELAEKCRQLEARNDTLIAKEVLFDEAIAAGAKMQRERDAAVEELSYSRKCSICKKHLSEGGDCYGNHKCGNGNPDWQWRGVRED